MVSRLQCHSQNPRHLMPGLSVLPIKMDPINYYLLGCTGVVLGSRRLGRLCISGRAGSLCVWFRVRGWAGSSFGGGENVRLWRGHEVV